MATFSNYQNILPDPNNVIGDSGAATGTVGGPGFKSVKLSSKTKTMKSRTNSGRILTRSHAYQQWDIRITYNPMTREEFEPVYNFLLFRQGALKPFYVSLPQYKTPRDTKFATYTSSNTVSVEGGDYPAGSTSMRIDGSAMTGPISGDPKPGDLFTITDASDAGHTKAYMVNRVETSTEYASGADEPTGPQSTDERRIHFTPPLSKLTRNNSTINFNDPKIRVILSKDVTEYSLGVNNLYSFSLMLEEVQP